ncbi:arabinose efflux permease family protein [Saccharomonospora marina XMU15]|uniref:Arabinose efflux permease family protein n=1 Tax=Saccharomonospora marina XMU15 TaxID=882083 RepID=H5WX23_9PSEU|nr:MFS transporter [Saccharomonospora marina]EHR53875.1 arabinose efflux permease family protein [Saccharomonospora marina XMU15]
MRIGGLVDTRPLRDSAAFRRLWVSTTSSTFGGQLLVVGVLAQVWQLSGSSVAVGAIGLANAVPTVVFGMIGGALADGLDRRRLVVLSTVGQLLSAAMLAWHAFAGIRSLPIVLSLVAVHAAFLGLSAPVRRTFVATLLPPRLVGAGIALTHLSFQVAMLAGPAAAGVVTARLGVGACYATDALALVIAVYGVWRLPAARPGGVPTRPGPRAIWEGWRFIGRSPALAGSFLTDVFATVLAMPVALFPAINAERFGGSPDTLGLFLSAIAVGGIAAGTASGLVTRSRRPGIIQLLAAVVWGAGIVGFGLAQPLWLALGFLAVSGGADTFAVIARGALVQVATPDSHRGRVSAVELALGMSGPDAGNFRAGVVAGWTSPAFAAVSGGLLCVAGVAGLGLRNKQLRRFRLPDSPDSARFVA